MRPPALASTSFWPKSKTPTSTTTRPSLRPDALKALEADSTELRDILKDYPDYKLTIEGHCDERGSAEYNVALGDRRAEAAKEYLVQDRHPLGSTQRDQLRQGTPGLPGTRRSLLAAEPPHPHRGHGPDTEVTPHRGTSTPMEQGRTDDGSRLAASPGLGGLAAGDFAVERGNLEVADDADQLEEVEVNPGEVEFVPSHAMTG